jgi:hypothetical protein
MFKKFRNERLNIFLEFPNGKVKKKKKKKGSTDFCNERKLFFAPFVHKARSDFGVIIIFNVTAQINLLHAFKTNVMHHTARGFQNQEK